MLAARRIALRADDEEARRDRRSRALADPVEQRLAEHGLVRDDEHVRAGSAADVDDDVLDRDVAGGLPDLVDERSCAASPTSSRDACETTISSIVLERRARPCTAASGSSSNDDAVRRDARAPQRGERTVEPAPGSRAARVA